MPERKKHIAFAVLIFAVALFLRLTGIGWGLKNDLHNQTYHPDEDVIFAYSQKIEPASLNFTPGFYNYGTLYLTMMRVATDMTSAYTGAPDIKSDDSFWSFVSRVHLVGRVLSALAGAATAVILFFIGLRFFGLGGGIASGLAIAFSSGHVIHSRFQTVDIIATFFLAVSALFALKLVRPPNAAEDYEMSPPLKMALLAGVFAGLSAGTKYTGILALFTLLVAIYASTRKFDKESLKLAGAGVAAALVVFFVTTPGALLDSERFMRDFRYEMAHTAEGHGLVFAGTSPGFIYHLGNLFSGIGILITLCGIGGMIFAAVKKQWWALGLLAFFVPYYFLIGRAEVKFLRYTFPLYVGIAAGFGYIIGETQRRESWRRTGVVFAILTIGGIDSGGLAGAARATAWMSLPDPRDSAARFVKKDAEKTPTAQAGYVRDPWFWSVPFFKDSALPRMPVGAHYITLIQQYGHPLYARVALMQGATAPVPVLQFQPVPAELGGDAVGPIDPRTVSAPDFDLKLIEQIKPAYITMTSLETENLTALAEEKDVRPELKGAVDHFLAFRTALLRDYRQLGTFGAPAPAVQDIQYVQPSVLVWKRKDL